MIDKNWVNCSEKNSRGALKIEENVQKKKQKNWKSRNFPIHSNWNKVNIDTMLMKIKRRIDNASFNQTK